MKTINEKLAKEVKEKTFSIKLPKLNCSKNPLKFNSGKELYEFLDKKSLIVKEKMKNESSTNGRPSFLALIELYVIHEITSNSNKVSKKLLNRCIEVKNKLIELPKVIADPKIKFLEDLKGDPWYYERLGMFSEFFTKGNYRGMSSIRLTDGSNLTKGDRLIFKEFEPDNKNMDSGMLVVETLFHYLKPISDFKKFLKPMDIELLTIVENHLNEKSSEDLVIQLTELSELKPDRIWFF
jgi:hypothetical protein